ncbi:MAG: hypothetical protein R3B45_03000 [Bdellovibrionota bacterium]
MRYLSLLSLLFWANFALGQNWVQQEADYLREEEYMQKIYLLSDKDDSYASIDCQSFIHEVKFFSENEVEKVNYLISDYECQELYSDLLYRMKAGKPTCLLLNLDTEELMVRNVCQ